MPFIQSQASGNFGTGLIDTSTPSLSHRQTVRRSSESTYNQAPLYPQAQDRPDIVFAYANAFGYKNAKDEFIPMSERQIIQPDIMFKAIVKAVKETKKKLTVHKRVLNF